MEYSTQVGVGTEFRLFFPVAVASARPPHKAIAPAEHHGQRTVLMLEEDERTRGLARSALSREGYRVIEAESLTTALVQFGGQVGQINLLMMNICLPDGLSTHALANCMREAKPDLKVLYTCAKEISSEDRAFLLAEGAGIIHKPYTPEKLVCAVQNSLGEEG
jgi:DNA-binding response OmpR family regulator